MQQTASQKGSGKLEIGYSILVIVSTKEDWRRKDQTRYTKKKGGVRRRRRKYLIVFLKQKTGFIAHPTTNKALNIRNQN